jgi:hypothetical protein
MLRVQNTVARFTDVTGFSSVNDYFKKIKINPSVDVINKYEDGLKDASMYIEADVKYVVDESGKNIVMFEDRVITVYLKAAVSDAFKMKRYEKAVRAKKIIDR